MPLLHYWSKTVLLLNKYVSVKSIGNAFQARGCCCFNVSLMVHHFWMSNSSNRYLTSQSTGETERITKVFLWLLPLCKLFINIYCLRYVLFEILYKTSSRKCYKILFYIAGQIKSWSKIFKAYFRNSIESLELVVLWFLSIILIFLWNLQQENE